LKLASLAPSTPENKNIQSYFKHINEKGKRMKKTGWQQITDIFIFCMTGIYLAPDHLKT
jgi:hypothetical protein